MLTKRRVLLTIGCLLAATLGAQLALGQEQPAGCQHDDPHGPEDSSRLHGRSPRLGICSGSYPPGRS